MVFYTLYPCILLVICSINMIVYWTPGGNPDHATDQRAILPQSHQPLWLLVHWCSDEVTNHMLLATRSFDTMEVTIISVVFSVLSHLYYI